MYPMLASPGKIEDLQKSNYIFEPKLDGVRCIAIISGVAGSPILLSRTHKNISAQFPDVQKQLSTIRTSCILDGEIIVRDLLAARSAYACDFQALQTRLQRIEDVQGAALEAPAEFIAFDLLESNGFPLYKGPWFTRRAELDLLASHYSIPTTQVMDHKTASLQWPLLIDDGCEGMMAKERGSPYIPGTRSKQWLKIKPMQEAEFIIGGLTHGYGRRKDLFGGLIVGQVSYANLKALRLFGHLEFAAVVGSGLTDAEMARLLDVLHITEACPFIMRPGMPAAKYWVDPTHIAKVKYQDLTNTKKLRFPTLISTHRLFLH